MGSSSRDFELDLEKTRKGQYTKQILASMKGVLLSCTPWERDNWSLVLTYDDAAAALNTSKGGGGHRRR